VYILEAHANDEWPIGASYSCLAQHKTLAERVVAAQQLRTKYGLQLPVYVDAMDNNFDRAYCAWPERFYVVDPEGDVAFISHPDSEWGFSRAKIEQDVRKAIRPIVVDENARTNVASNIPLPEPFRNSRNLYQRLSLNRSLVLKAEHFNRVWTHFDPSNTGSMSHDTALRFLKELASFMEIDYNEDRAMAIIESCRSQTAALDKKQFERVFAIWTTEQGMTLSGSVEALPAEVKPPC